MHGRSLVLSSVTSLEWVRAVGHFSICSLLLTKLNCPAWRSGYTLQRISSTLGRSKQDADCLLGFFVCLVQIKTATHAGTLHLEISQLRMCSDAKQMAEDPSGMHRTPLPVRWC